MIATRTAASAGLPWTLHVFAPPDLAAASSSSPRRQLLMLILAVVALVLAAGWYFILRAVTRELRVSRLQSDFVAAVSHEFRSPLTSLSHIAEMLAHDRLPSDEVRRRSYGVLVRDTDRLRWSRICSTSDGSKRGPPRFGSRRSTWLRWYVPRLRTSRNAPLRMASRSS
jgi:hypothetical protein